MERRGRGYMIIITLLFSLFLQPAQGKDSEKARHVQTLVETCEEAMKTKMAFDKYKKVCRCFKKEMEKLNVKELRHLVLADAGKTSESAFPVDQAYQLENYKLEIAYICMGEELPEVEAPKDSDSN